MISEAAIQFGMQEALQQLGIKEINEGTSTGTKWFSNGKIIESYSPATGDLIGK
ncbi:MAG: aldehyde dehydrogenase family protein, partial [Flavobacterium sp.]